MVKITILSVSPNYEVTPYKVTVNYSLDKNEFYADLPEEVYETLKGTRPRRLTNESRESLEAEIRSTIKSWWNGLKVKKKVLAYQFECNAYVPDPESTKDRYKPPLFKREDITFTGSPAIALSYIVCYQVKAANGEVSYVDERDRSVFDRLYEAETYKIMPWTQEGEDFFSQFADLLNNTAWQIHQWLSRPEELLERIQASGSLPFFNKSQMEARS